MIVIDKLCYNSRLRYVNAGEKFIFAVLTLLACVISRSIAVACIALAVTGILTVKKGGIPFSRYLHFMTVPLVFLFFSTLAIVLNFPGRPLIFCLENRLCLADRKQGFPSLCHTAYPEPPWPAYPACIFFLSIRPCRIS